MYEDIMRRPMFQNAQQRAGSGIMAGVAPVQGFERGGGVRATERNIENNDELSFMDYARVAPEVLQEMVVGEDGTMGDFFSMEKTEEGQGLNLRDITDFLVVDPDDPEDVAIATATAGLMATGVGAPGAIVAKLGRMGFKGKKVANAVEKAIRLGVGDTKGKTFGRGQTARMLLPSDAVAEEEGIASLPQAREVAESPKEGIASLPQKSGRFGEGEQKIRNNLANVSKEQLDAYGGSLTQYMNEFNKTGKRPTSIKKMAEGDMVSALTSEELDDLGLTAEEFEALDNPVKEQYIDLINDRRLASQVGYNLGVLPGGAVDIATAIPRGISQLADEFSGSRVGRALGLSEPGEEVEDFEMFPVAGSALEGIEENMPVTESDIVSALREKPELPVLPESVVDEDAMDDIDVASGGEGSDNEATPRRGGKIKKFLGNIQEKLSDPRTRYAIAKANQPSEGFATRNALSDMVLGAQEYDLIQKQKDDETALEQNIEALQELMPEASTNKILNLLLSKDTASETKERYQDTLLTLFTEAKKDPQNSGKSNDELLKEAANEATAIVFGGVNSLGGVSSQTGDTIPLQEPE
jgi:hypothetical protein